MKALLTALFLLLASFAYATVSIDDIVKLSKLKTSDEVILNLLQKEGLNRPITFKDVIFLKQQGVSERVIQYMLKLSDMEVQKQPPQQGKSVYINENMRAYYTTTKKGKQIRIVTNLDEAGKRMGGEIPPDPEPQEQYVVRSEGRPAQEIRVVVEDSRRDRDYDEPDYPEYVDDRYVTPGYPLYSPYYPIPSYYPHFPKGKGHHHKRGSQIDPNQPNWNFDYSNANRQRPQHQPSPSRIPSSKPQGAKPLRSFKG
ncbi:hypothetical protein L0222_22495 [bacterium]|nr:hypothetical protein [bacterium]MCI0603440.1 hypothetical protein [bacterium]